MTTVGEQKYGSFCIVLFSLPSGHNKERQKSIYFLFCSFFVLDEVSIFYRDCPFVKRHLFLKYVYQTCPSGAPPLSIPSVDGCIHVLQSSFLVYKLFGFQV